MRHRHLDVEEGTPVAGLGLAALDDLLERGDLADWRPVLAVIRRDPGGAVADRILHLLEHHPLQGTARLWRTWIADLRKDETEPPVGDALRALRRARGLSQRALGERLGMTQPEISRLERRRDARVSVVRAYVRALGGELEIGARFGDELVRLD
jgi:hypothetical protein